MIAAAILAVGLLTIALAQVSALKMGSRSKHLSEAVYLAQEQVETFKAMNAGDLTFTSPGTFEDEQGYLYPGHAPGDEEMQAGGLDQTRYSRRWTIEPDQPSAGLTRITIAVDWENADSNTGSTELVWIKGAN
jgi:Tfp pilus assembly protein PilV